ncbi:hypothetical protein CHISP_2728 [Chitinispirillum alkaliphilum]|nr:hypothetical protein CHISP_2728 [Chitinispirillum alkaliphilum]
MRDMKTLIKLLLNSFTLVLALAFNYLSNTDLLSERTVGEISDKYQTVITPAGYAFSIWGLIYLLLILFVLYQWIMWRRKGEIFIIEKTGYFFALSNVVNALWVVVWVNELIVVSLILILLLLVFLYAIVKRLDLEKWDAAAPVILFVWWPISIYFGWVILATVLNVLIFLVSIGYDEWLLGANGWGFLLLTISTAVYLYFLYSRNLRESAVVGVWGFSAIAVAQFQTNRAISIVSIIGAIFLLVNVVYHAFRNRAFSAIRRA